MRKLVTALIGMIPTAALASSEPFLSLYNTHTVVLIAFVLFLGVLIYLGVHRKVGEMLDARAEGIRKDLAEARALREEAENLLAEYDAKQKEVAENARRLVAAARREAEDAAKVAREELDESIRRRMKAAEEQIASAEAAAVRQVRDQAVDVAVAAAREVIAKAMSASEANKLIDDAIGEVQKRLH
ncbi:MAG: ATP F0F1 synthase subunit B [Alphaproteobacteria bacterium]|nr:MAG: ATP F0F1 synthase subunit B [Alphaproteobacteria bacterium]